MIWMHPTYDNVNESSPTKEEGEGDVSRFGHCLPQLVPRRQSVSPLRTIHRSTFLAPER
jgi:hypothetical protein